MSFEELKRFKVSDILQIPLKNGVSKPSRIRGEGIKMVNMGELFANSIIRNIPMERVPMTDKELSSSMLEYGDLLFARQSLTVEGAGKCSIFLSDDEPTTYEGHLIRLRVNKVFVDPNYVYYYFKSSVGANKIKTIVTSTAAAGIRGSDLLNLEIELPPLKTQTKFASILSSLDDKIELNRQTNQTLEAIAQALFKEWFVDFNFPGAAGEMQDTELGEIPKGWRVYKIGELVDSMSITHKFPKGEAIFLNTSDIEEGRILKNEYSKKEDLPGQAKKSIQKGDILFTEIRPANRRYALIDFDAEDFVVSTKLMVLRTIADVESIVVFNFLTSYDTLKELQHLAESRSGTFPQITFAQVKDLKIVLPNNELLRKYESLAWLIFRWIKNNEEQTKTLIELRDNLLPKLMKGEITL